MIRLTRLSRSPIVLNSDLIEHIEVTPDTVITLTTGEILRVCETADEVVRRIVEFRRRILSPGADWDGCCQAGTTQASGTPNRRGDTGESREG